MKSRTAVWIVVGVVASVVVVAVVIAYRIDSSIRSAWPKETSGSGALDFLALARQAETDCGMRETAGLSWHTSALSRPPTLAGRLPGGLMHSGRLLVGDILLASRFEPADAARPKVGAFRLAACDLRTRQLSWRGVPTFSYQRVLGLSANGVTALMQAQDMRREQRAVALAVATSRAESMAVDPTRFVLKAMLRRVVGPGAGEAEYVLASIGPNGIRKTSPLGTGHPQGLGLASDRIAVVDAGELTVWDLAFMSPSRVGTVTGRLTPVDVAVRPALVGLSRALLATEGETEGGIPHAEGEDPDRVSKLEVSAVDPGAGRVLWRRSLGFPAVAVWSDARASSPSRAVLLHIAEETSGAPGGRIQAFGALDGKPLWRKPIVGPQGLSLFGDRAFSGPAPDGRPRYFATAAEPTEEAIAERLAGGRGATAVGLPEPGVMIVDVALGSGTFITRRDLGLAGADDLRLVWAGDDLLVLGAGRKPHVVLVDVARRRARWAVGLPGPVTDLHAGVIANGRWIVAGDWLLRR